MRKSPKAEEREQGHNTKGFSYGDYMANYLKGLAAVRQAKIDLALRDGHRAGFTLDGRVCVVEREQA